MTTATRKEVLEAALPRIYQHAIARPPLCVDVEQLDQKRFATIAVTQANKRLDGLIERAEKIYKSEDSVIGKSLRIESLLEYFTIGIAVDAWRIYVEGNSTTYKSE